MEIQTKIKCENDNIGNVCLRVIANEGKIRVKRNRRNIENLKLVNQNQNILNYSLI